MRTLSEAEYNDLWRLAEMTTAEIKVLWDRYDGCNSPDGISGEAIHYALNCRGEGGGYCAV